MQLIKDRRWRGQLNAVAGVLVAGFVCVLLSGCVSRPEPVDQNYAALLYEEEGIFLQIRPNQNLELANRMLSAVGMDPESMQTVLQRTHTAFCLFEFDSGAFEYTIIGEGRYPETIAALSLRGNSEWERREGGRETGDLRSAPLRWWRNRLSGLELSFIQDNTVCITNADIEEKLERIFYGPVIPLPEEGAQLLDTGLLGIFSKNPDFGGLESGRAGTNRAEMNRAGTRIAELFARLDTLSMSFHGSEKHDDLFTIDAEYACEDRAVARSLFLVLRLALLSGLRSLEGEYDYTRLISEDPISLQERRVVLRGYPMSLDNIDWFFQQALPYIQIEE
ncbi:MAG: hypothetical protein ACOC2R_01665 [Spirochaetota bacterium]